MSLLKKIYDKNEVNFAIMLIVFYVVLMGNIKKNHEIGSLYTVIPLLVIATILTMFIFKYKLLKKYGLVGVKNPKKFLYFIPLLLICLIQLIWGFEMKYSLSGQILAIISMLLIGYNEEIIFRGFLFKGIAKDNLKQAIIISSLTFGIGHIINLLTGANNLDTILQIAYAISLGFVFVYVFYKSGSLWPCIITHGAFNSISTMTNESNSLNGINMKYIIFVAFIMIVTISYAAYLSKIKNEN